MSAREPGGCRTKSRRAAATVQIRSRAIVSLEEDRVVMRHRKSEVHQTALTSPSKLVRWQRDPEALFAQVCRDSNNSRASRNQKAERTL